MSPEMAPKMSRYTARWGLDWIRSIGLKGGRERGGGGGRGRGEGRGEGGRRAARLRFTFHKHLLYSYVTYVLILGNPKQNFRHSRFRFWVKL